MSENQSLPSRQRGPSANARPSSRTSVVFVMGGSIPVDRAGLCRDSGVPSPRGREAIRGGPMQAGDRALAAGAHNLARPPRRRLAWAAVVWLVAIVVLSAVATVEPKLLL